MKPILFKNSRIFITAFILFILASLAVADSANAGKWARDENGKVYNVEKAWEERRAVELNQDARVAEIAATQPNVYRKYIQNAIDTQVLEFAKLAADAQKNERTGEAAYYQSAIASLQGTSGQNVNIYKKTTAEWATSFEGNTNYSDVAAQDRIIMVWINGGWEFLPVKSGDLVTLSAENYQSNLCIGWGCLAAGYKRDGGNGSDAIIIPSDWTPPPGFTPPPSWTPPPGWSPLPLPSPTPIPTAADITKFEITNFRLQTALNGVDYYQVLKEQMAVNHENYQLNLVWGVRGASSCTASCKYVNIDDYLANQNWDELQAQTWPCSQNIDGNVTFSGDVDKEYGSAKTKPKENGIIRYTLSCQGETGNDRKDLLVVIQAFQWFESIPILNQ